MLKNIRTQNNKIKQRSYTKNHSIQASKIDVLLAITNRKSMWQVPLYTAVYNHQQQISSNKEQKYVKNNQMEKH
jgi:hypothetical protein